MIGSKKKKAGKKVIAKAHVDLDKIVDEARPSSGTDYQDYIRSKLKAVKG